MPKVEYIGTSSFSGCSSLPEISLPSLTFGDANCFYRCYIMKNADLPNLERTGGGMFGDCQQLTTINIPKLKAINGGDINRCNKLEVVDLPSVESVAQYGIRNSAILKTVKFGTVINNFASQAFYYCSKLEIIIIQNPNVLVTLTNKDAFIGTKIASGSGFIYVPDNLVDNYKTATNWSVYANQIKPLSEYVEQEAEQ